MKVIIVETTNLTPHLETSLEIAKNHLEEGREVDFHFLGYSVDVCENILDQPSRLQRAFNAFPEVIGCSLLASPGFRFYKPQKRSLMQYPLLPSFQDIEELRLYKYGAFHAGISALSTLISRVRDPRPSLSEHKELLRGILYSGISVYEYCIELFLQTCPDSVCLFNGRFAVNRAIRDASSSLDIPFLIHERGSSPRKYFYHTFTPHDLNRIRREIVNHWNNRPACAWKIAAEYFINKRAGKDPGWHSFLDKQVEGKISIDLPQDRKIITYFSSSDDEIAAVEEVHKWSNTWSSQHSAFQSLLRIISRHRHLFLVIRLHPSKVNKPTELAAWLRYVLPENSAIIMPGDYTDSYSLLERSDVVVTSGSTTGIESVFWGIPSICLGPSLYSALDAVYLPDTADDLQELILADNLIANPHAAQPYGYYMATFGTPFKHYRAESLSEGKFLGHRLQSFGILSLLAMLRGKVSLVVRALKTFHLFKAFASSER